MARVHRRRCSAVMVAYCTLANRLTSVWEDPPWSEQVRWMEPAPTLC